MKNRTKIAIVLLMIFYIPITMFVVITTQNIPFPILNPPAPLNVIPIGLSYPDTPGLTIPGTDLIISFVIAFNGSIAENVPLEIANATGQTISLAYTQEVWYVQVGFQQAIPWNFKDVFRRSGMYIGGLTGLTLRHDFANSNNSVLVPSMDVIYFPVAGDFSPAIRIVFNNGTQVLYTYNQMKVHVLSASEVESMNTNKLNLALSYALLFFSYIEGFVVIRELSKADESEANAIKSHPRKASKTAKISSPSTNTPIPENQNS